jgi:peptide-methionine (S)-S-oxide reductase
MTTNQEAAYFGGGCFWCTEAIFNQLKGVLKVTPGYAGGHIPNPSYFQVSEELTGHAEVIEVIFDPKLITYQQLLDIFWHTHNPTTLNRQGADVGTQYRSIILYTSPEQEQAARKMKSTLQEEQAFSQSIVTEIVPFEHFYPAEDYHHNYYDNNREARYCQVVIDPKVGSFKQKYAALLK